MFPLREIIPQFSDVILNVTIREYNMRYRDVIDLIDGGENQHCEFKQRFSSYEKMAKELIAFANTSGGYILIGVEDNGEIAGVRSEKEVSALLAETAADYCDPPIVIQLEYFSVEGKELVIAGIPESGHKPHRIQDYQPFNTATAQVYVRVNDKSVPASKEMVRVMKASAQSDGLKKYVVGALEQKIFGLLEQKEMITVNDVCTSLNVSNRRASRALVKLVRAGVLLIHTSDSGEDRFSSK